MLNNRKDIIENWINGIDKRFEIIMVNIKRKRRGSKVIREKIINELRDN